MASRKTRTLLTTFIVILGSGVLGFIFWTSDKYRAATPLVFILGAIILLIPALRSLMRFFMQPGERAVATAAQAAAEAQKSQSLLWRSGLPHLIVNLYFAHIQHYPKWVQESRDYVPSSVTNAGLTDEGWVRLLLYLGDYIFPCKQWKSEGYDSDEFKEGVLEVIHEGKRVLTMQIRRAPGKNGTPRWAPVSVESFAAGSWVRDFQNLKAEIMAIIKDRERDARES